MNQTQQPHDHESAATSTPAPLCPIPRNGLPRPASLWLFILLTLATALFGVGVAAMRTTSPAEVKVAEIASLVVSLLLLIHLWRVSRAAKGVVPILFLVGLLLSYLCHSLIPAAVLISLVFALGEGAILVATIDQRRATWLPLIPLVAYSLTVLASRDPVGSLAALVPFPAILVLAWGTRRSAARADGLTRVGVLCATSLTLGLSITGMVALSLYRYYGSLDTSVLLPALNEFREGLIITITQMELPAGATEEMKALLSYDNAANLVNGTINLLPGLFVAGLNILSAIAQLILLTGLATFGYGDSVTERVRLFRLSLVSCFVFTVSYAIVMFAGDGPSTLAGTVAECFYIILLPGLALAGLLRLTASLARRGARGMGCMFYLILIVPCLLLLAPFVLAIYEVIAHFYTAILSRLRPPEA